jgi:hypothetical protein
VQIGHATHTAFEVVLSVGDKCEQQMPGSTHMLNVWGRDEVAQLNDRWGDSRGR